MRFTITTTLISAAFAATASAVTPSTSATYQLKVYSSANPSINGSFLALKDTDTGLNALGVWSTGPVRSSYQVTLSTSPSDSRLYELKNGRSQLVLYGQREAMPLYDTPIGTNPTLKTGEGFYKDKFTFLSGPGSTEVLNLRHAQDFNTSGTDLPSGGAGSWRACRGDNAVDYQMYWYDGSSPLPIKNCEGVSLELVASTPQAAASATQSGFLPGVTAPAASGTSGTYLPGATSNASATSGSPKQSAFPGTGSQIEIKGVIIGMAAGAMALMI